MMKSSQYAATGEPKSFLLQRFPVAVQRGNTSVNGGMLLMMCCSYITVLCFIPCIIDAIIVFMLHRCIKTYQYVHTYT